MTKRSSLFATLRPVETVAPVPEVDVLPSAPADGEGRRYPLASTRKGKRVATVYLEHEALRQLQRLAFNEETTLQALLVEGINSVFEARGLSRIA